MKITSLNLQGITDWTSHEQAIKRYVEYEDPDIIVFQEVVYLPGESPFNQVERLNKGFGYPHLHSAVTRLQPGINIPVWREGLALLSKFPVVMTSEIVLSQDPTDHLQRIIQLADIKIGTTLLKLANVHFSFPEALGVKHLAETLEILRARGETRVIIGDYNISDLSARSTLWADNYVASTATPYISHPDDNTRIDYALVPKGLAFEQIEVSPKGLSDHLALTVTVDVAGSAA